MILNFGFAPLSNFRSNYFGFAIKKNNFYNFYNLRRSNSTIGRDTKE